MRSLGIDTSNYTTSVALYDGNTNSVIQKKKLSIEESFEQVEGTPEDMSTIMSTFVVRHEGRVIEASGYGSSKKEADNNASKAVLAKLRPYIDTGLPAGLL